MREHLILFSTALIVASGCAPAPEAPKDARGAARAQAELSTDEEQAKLWQQAADTGAAEGIERLSVEGAAVRRRQPIVVADQKIEVPRKPYPETVQNALSLVSAVELEEPWSGPVRLTAVEGEFLSLDLGDNRLLTLHTKVRGAPLRATQGETGQLLYQVGDPFARNDILALKLENDDLLYALVGGDGPVSLKVEAYGLSAQQIGEPEGNTMAVKLSAGRESHTLEPGEQALFRQAGLTVELRASVAVQGESANALPGRPYRIELLGWRTK